MVAEFEASTPAKFNHGPRAVQYVPPPQPDANARVEVSHLLHSTQHPVMALLSDYTCRRRTSGVMRGTVPAHKCGRGRQVMVKRRREYQVFVSPWCELEGTVQAPHLVTDARLRPSRFKPHEEQQLEDMACRPAFQALPIK